MRLRITGRLVNGTHARYASRPSYWGARPLSGPRHRKLWRALPPNPPEGSIPSITIADVEEMREVLEREVYWLEGKESEPPGTAQEIRAALDRLAQVVKNDFENAAPWTDPGLRRGSRFRRVKIVMHRVFRPLTRRYDRITAELAATGAVLADLLGRAEAQIGRLEAELAALRRRLEEVARPPSEPSGLGGAGGVAAPTVGGVGEESTRPPRSEEG